MTDKRLKWLNALLLVTAVYLGAKSGYNLISSRLDDLYIPSALVQSEPTSAIKPDRPLSYYRPIIDRNLMNTTPPETTIPDRTTTDKMRKTDLKLKLLGTVAVSGDRRYAVIEETATGQQKLYREGTAAQNAVIKHILREKVVLRVNGRDEILEVDESRLILEIGEAKSDSDNATDRTALMEAVNQGRIEKIELLIAQGEDVDARDSYGNTALILAARSGRSEIVRLLLDNGAEVHQKDNVGNTPLIDSARYASESAIDVIRILISKGADVQAENIYSNTALMNAVRSGQIEVVELLLREGADINARSKTGQTPLKLATDSLRKDVIAILTDYGAMQ
jgi:ankyrin repeat protein